MNKYKELLVNELFGEKANDVQYENYCLKVNEILLKFISDVDASRKKMLRDSIDKSASCSYSYGRRSCSREEMISLYIQGDIKRRLKNLKASIDSLL